MTKILIVDDEPMMLMIAKRALSKNYEILTAGSGAEGIEVFEREEPALVLSDLMMPEMNGFEMHQQMQERAGHKIPIMFMTADESEEIEGKGFDVGAQDFIRKPFRPDVLLRRVENILGNLDTIRGLTEKAMTDKLTGLLNKSGAIHRLTEACASESGSLMILDLDSFKAVNDLYGHAMGDKILSSFAEIIRFHTRRSDIPGRIGGDEFILFLKDRCDVQSVASLTERLNQDLVQTAKQLMGEDMSIPLGVSVGAVFVPEHGADYALLFRMADKALYTVKQNGKHGYAVFGEELAGAEEGHPASAGSGEKTMASGLQSLDMIFAERSEPNTAFTVGKESFMHLYRFILRYIRSYRGCGFKLLFTLEPECDEADFAAASEKFGEVMERTLRSSDIMARIRQGQFFILLPHIREEEFEELLAHLLETWEQEPETKNVRIEREYEMITGTGPDA